MVKYYMCLDSVPRENDTDVLIFRSGVCYHLKHTYQCSQPP